MMIIDKPGKSKQELLNSLEKLKTDFAKEISEYDVKLSPITDGYNLKGSKKIVFIEFSVDVNIQAEEGKYVINYTSKNVPQGQIDKAMVKVKEVLDKC
ncbi:MAG: hypothetical protein WBQ38_13410 [Ignavibacteria bacterium]|nr:hypothetical protein [Ignavibacteria bacterium]MBL0106600.1 hypothetical protein [Ignavibacteria bacterium]